MDFGDSLNKIKTKSKKRAIMRPLRKRKTLWFRSPGWWATASAVVLAIPVCFAGVNWVVTTIEAQGAKSVHIAESQKQLDQNTSDVSGLKTSVQQISTTLQIGDQKLTALVDGVNEVKADVKKQGDEILWFLKKTYSDQSRNIATQPSLAKRERREDEPEDP
jgi:septal ring factor EnvC (AmiA/AmiB activator)